LEKLLNSCTEIKTIYVLLRPKKDNDGHQRLVQMLNSKPFTFNLHESQLKKVVAIEGDISFPNLGLSDCDRKILTEQVHIVFHVAASVKFDAVLR
jgi:thioester reductase-like protein